MAAELNTAEIDAVFALALYALSPAGYTKMLLYGGSVIGIKAEELTGEYAPDPGGRPLKLFYTLDGKPSKFKSRKQRAFVMAAIRSGAMPLPYRRTGKLGASINSKRRIEGASLIIVVGTRIKYAQYVIGAPGVQSHYHAETGWKSLVNQLEAGKPALLETARDAFAEGFRREFKKGNF